MQVSKTIVYLSDVSSYYRIPIIQGPDPHGLEEEGRGAQAHEGGAAEGPKELQELHGLACLWAGVQVE